MVDQLTMDEEQRQREISEVREYAKTLSSPVVERIADRVCSPTAVPFVGPSSEAVDIDELDRQRMGTEAFDEWEKIRSRWTTLRDSDLCSALQPPVD